MVVSQGCHHSILRLEGEVCTKPHQLVHDPLVCHTPGAWSRNACWYSEPFAHPVANQISTQVMSRVANTAMMVLQLVVQALLAIRIFLVSKHPLTCPNLRGTCSISGQCPFAGGSLHSCVCHPHPWWWHGWWPISKHTKSKRNKQLWVACCRTYHSGLVATTWYLVNLAVLSTVHHMACASSRQTKTIRIWMSLRMLRTGWVDLI